MWVLALEYLKDENRPVYTAPGRRLPAGIYMWMFLREREWQCLSNLLSACRLHLRYFCYYYYYYYYYDQLYVEVLLLLVLVVVEVGTTSNSFPD